MNEETRPAALLWIGIPFVASTVLATLYYGFYPMISPAMGATHAIQAIAILAAILIPAASSRMLRLRPLLPIAIWAAATALGLVFDRGAYEGNQNLGLAGHLLGYQLAAFCMTLLYCRSRLRREITRTPAQ